jgi:hypothetical protein
MMKVTWRVFNQLNVWWRCEGYANNASGTQDHIYIFSWLLHIRIKSIYLIGWTLSTWPSLYQVIAYQNKKHTFNWLNTQRDLHHIKLLHIRIKSIHIIGWIHILHTSIGVLKWDIYDPIIIWKLKRLNMPTERLFIPLCRK